MKLVGFSRLNKIEKIKLINSKFFQNNKSNKDVNDKFYHSDVLIENLKSFWHQDEKTQRLFDDFSENTISNYYMPFGVAPNVLINDKIYCVPMVIEESSVVAAASKSAKFWLERGGFKAKVLGTQKIGHVHLDWSGDMAILANCLEEFKREIFLEIEALQANMLKRGGGVTSISFIDNSLLEAGFCKIEVAFETCDAMGANFINTILEAIGHKFKRITQRHLTDKGEVEVLMCILSNYTPECKVRVSVSCPISNLDELGLEMTPELFAQKFYKAVRLAQVDTSRATTHNKGIFNGIDSVVLATGNDFRAVEACGHTYAARDGKYKGLTYCKIEEGIFSFWIDLPISIGTIGGLTSLHPLAKFSLDLLGRPSSEELMMIIATIGLAQNFAAIRSLVTSGIQKGHMKMHLMNILNHLEANKVEREKALVYFENRSVTYSFVREFLGELRNYQ